MTLLGDDNMAETTSEDEGPARRREPLRRCLASGEVLPKERMIRFVVGPEGRLLPDVGGDLPGRGLWIGANRAMVQTAIAKGLFAKAARTKLAVPPALADWIEELLVTRCLDRLGLARRAGQAVAGFEKVKGWLADGRAALLIEASDGGADGLGKIAAKAVGLPVLTLFRADELGAALGRERTVHVAVAAGALAQKLRDDAERLAGFRTNS